jgi:predicted alpha/beta-hydrolase family hydrolase
LAVESEVRFPTASESGEARGILHTPSIAAKLALVIAHGRSNDMRNPFAKRVATEACDHGWLALRFNFRYIDAKRQASRDLSAEEDDLRGSVRFVRRQMPVGPIFVAGKSMGARVCAMASSDPDIGGVIALGYPLHPMFKPQVRNPPEWPKLVKAALFVQGDHDPFCDLARLREELPRLTEPHELVVIPDAGHSFESKGPKRDTFPEVWRVVASWLDQKGHSIAG